MIVPDDVAVDVDASASAGEVTVFGRSESGVDADLSGKASRSRGPTGRFASTHTSGWATSSSNERRRSAMVDVGTIPARDRANGVVAGVAAGIGRALEVDPTLVRLLFALLALAGGAGIALYLAAALLMPDELGERPGRVRFAAGMTLLLLAAVAVLNGLGLPWFVQISAVLAAGGVFFLWRKQQRVLGGVLVVTGAVVLFTERRRLRRRRPAPHAGGIRRRPAARRRPVAVAHGAGA